MSMTCLKCGLVNPGEVANTAACPRCGVIYAKAQSAPFRRSESGPVTPDPTHGLGGYVRQLREQSLYPTFRAVVGVCYWVSVAVAAIVMIGGAVAFFRSGPVVGLSTIGGAAFFWLIMRSFREAGLMLADLSDAAVRIAQQGTR